MVLSHKSRYAVRAVLELAKRQGEPPVKAATIASSQQIPARFLENILAQLRQGGVVESVRGKEGGYSLLRPPADISVGEIVRMFEGQLDTVVCKEVATGQDCPLQPGCALLPMWEEAHKAMMDVFDNTTFADLLAKERAAEEAQALDYVI